MRRKARIDKKTRQRIVMGAAWGHRAFVLRLRPWRAAVLCIVVLLAGAWSIAITASFVTRGFDDAHRMRREAERVRQRDAETRAYETRILLYRRRIAEEETRTEDLDAQVKALRERERAAEGTLVNRFRALLAKQKEIERRQDAVNEFLGKSLRPQRLDIPDPPDESKFLPWIEKLSERLANIAASHQTALNRFEREAIRDVHRLRAVLARLGLERPVEAYPSQASSFAAFPVSVSTPSAFPARTFEEKLARARRSRNTLAHLRDRSRRLPIGRPLGFYAVTSGFGKRRHPFLRRQAFHPGVDMKAAYGEPVRAAAPGRVAAASYAGTYGRVVVLDHGDGISTRYAHLSATSVRPGQNVAAGAIVGRAGSSGRSTGTHLHYETRVRGKPLDPRRFLRAASEIKALLR